MAAHVNESSDFPDTEGVESGQNCSGTARKDGEVCEHRRMMYADQLFSPWKILIVSILIILVIVVIFARMYSRRSR